MDLEKVRAWASHEGHSAADCERGDKVMLQLADEVERLRLSSHMLKLRAEQAEQREAAIRKATGWGLKSGSDER